MEASLQALAGLSNNFGPLMSLFLFVAIIVERAFDRGWIRFGNQTVGANTMVEVKSLLEKVLASQTGLQHHFNDETTELLKEIVNNQGRGFISLDTIHTSLNDGFREVSDKFREYDKYGIKIATAK